MELAGKGNGSVQAMGSAIEGGRWGAGFGAKLAPSLRRRWLLAAAGVLLLAAGATAGVLFSGAHGRRLAAAM